MKARPPQIRARALLTCPVKHPASPRSSSFDSQQKWQALSFEALKAFELPDGMLQIRDSATAPA